MRSLVRSLRRRTAGALCLWAMGLAFPAFADETDAPAAAARFLTQATFGPTLADIAALQAAPSFAAWLDAQFAQPPSLQEPYVRDRCPEVSDRNACNIDTWVPSRHDAWWLAVVDGRDQLRQRVAFALSQILVVSDRDPTLKISQFGLANYYDMLVRGAFGNYRDLLGDVARHPVMGIYLSMLRNQKADPARNIRPDENFARELLQLFTVGVNLLEPDGTPKRDPGGRPIPTYDERTIREFARVFTGWNYAGIGWETGLWRADRARPMEPVESYHDKGAKLLLNGVVIPAGNTAAADLDAALDNVFAHPNVGPFIAGQLIQRLVTSNPTPGYVRRVAAVFDDNGRGERGDLAAVVRAILLDDEARNGPVNLPDRFGKLREPLLEIAHLLRAFRATKKNDGEWGDYPGTPVYRLSTDTYQIDGEVGQALLRAPTVFNFYRPDYAPPGAVREAGLVGPEFEILSDNNLAAGSNIVNALIHWASPDNPWASTLNFDVEARLADDPQALMDHLDVLLMNGQMSQGLRRIVVEHLETAWYPSGPAGRVDRARDAVSLLMMSPEYQVQK